MAGTSQTASAPGGRRSCRRFVRPPPANRPQRRVTPIFPLGRPNRSLHARGLAECDEATAVPVDYEAVPWNVECKDMMTAPVERQAVPQRMPRSNVSLRSPVNRGLAGLSGSGLTFLGRKASGLFGALRSSAGRLSAALRSQRRPAVQLERSAHGAIVVALRQNRPLGKRECKDRGGRDCYCK